MADYPKRLAQYFQVRFDAFRLLWRLRRKPTRYARIRIWQRVGVETPVEQAQREALELLKQARVAPSPYGLGEFSLSLFVRQDGRDLPFFDPRFSQREFARTQQLLIEQGFPLLACARGATIGAALVDWGAALLDVPWVNRATRQ